MAAEVFVPNAREKYRQRPSELEALLLSSYITDYHVLTRTEAERSRHLAEALFDRAGRPVLARTKPLIPRYRYLTPSNGEDYFFQYLLLHVPFRDTAELLSVTNQTRTYHEECILRGLLEQAEDAETLLREAYQRGFDPLQLVAQARRLVIDSIATKEKARCILQELGIDKVRAQSHACDPQTILHS